MNEIIPGILEQEWSAIEKKIQQVQSFASTIHIDLLDGKFASNKTFLDPKPFAPYTKHMTCELHMMVEDPSQYVESFGKVGFTRFIGHIEQMPDQSAFVAKAKEFGEAALALDAQTTVNAITVPYEYVDAFLVMTIQAGFSGQTFLPEMLDKVRYLRAQTDCPIEVDGGINDETLIWAKQAGANRFVSTSFLFKAEDIYAQYLLLAEKE